MTIDLRKAQNRSQKDLFNLALLLLLMSRDRKGAR